MSRLLLVEDEDEVRFMIQSFLTEEGHAVAAVSGGAQALELLGKGKFDLMILDHNMPKMTGTDVLLEIRAHAKYAKLPVLICTSDPLFLRKAEKGTAIGNLDGCISKPVDLKKLIALVEKLARPAK